MKSCHFITRVALSAMPEDLWQNKICMDSTCCLF
jgi:hypothetical protein